MTAYSPLGSPDRPEYDWLRSVLGTEKGVKEQPKQCKIQRDREEREKGKEKEKEKEILRRKEDIMPKKERNTHNLVMQLK